ncbi:MAG: hypothetical protein WCP20_11005 [Desulfuromonadales bacterium]
MANTITGLIADLYVALDVVSREQVGFIPSVTVDASVNRAAVGQNVTSFVAPASTASDITPGVTPPNDGDQTIGYVTAQITKARRVPLRWNGEQTLALNNNGPGQLNVKQAQLAQAVRTLTNEMEADLAGLHAYASRAYGTAGTAPFASTLADPANVRKILTDNGAPLADMSLVIDSTAGAKLRTLAQLTKANEAGTADMRSQGTLLDIHGFKLRESGKVVTVASVGNNTGTYAANGAHAVGATTITVKTGTGTILAGDVIQFGTDTANSYVVTTGCAAAGTIVIGAPGLRVALAGNEAVTIIAASTRNLAFERTAILLATRMPALPEEGDLAVDRVTITDPRSGLSFEIALYPQYRQMQYEISACWGVKMIKPEHCAILLG